VTESIFKLVDVNNDKHWDLEELASVHKHTNIFPKVGKKAFRDMDTDNNGLIEAEEYAKSVRQSVEKMPKNHQKAALDQLRALFLEMKAALLGN